MALSLFGLGSLLLMGQPADFSSAAAGRDCKSVRRFMTGILAEEASFVVVPPPRFAGVARKAWGAGQDGKASPWGTNRYALAYRSS